MTGNFRRVRLLLLTLVRSTIKAIRVSAGKRDEDGYTRNLCVGEPGGSLAGGAAR